MASKIQLGITNPNGRITVVDSATGQEVEGVAGVRVRSGKEPGDPFMVEIVLENAPVSLQPYQPLLQPDAEQGEGTTGGKVHRLKGRGHTDD